METDKLHLEAHMINKLQKRDCDINIKLLPGGAQYLHFEMNVAGDK